MYLDHLSKAVEVMSLHPTSIRIIHYNDVYNISEGTREPLGGAARFITALQQTIREHDAPYIVIFSGDAFSPAPLTPITQGAEMPPVLNATNTSIACVGNHELDNGIDTMLARISETNFPWILSNIFHKPPHHFGLTDWRTHGARALAGLSTTHTLTRSSIKFGFIGLASHDWLETFNTIDIDTIQYIDYCEVANHFAARLREQKCHFIIAITHMRTPDDERLARQVPEVDLILGGHDHIIFKKIISGRWVVKSGTDFKVFSTIDLHDTGDGRLYVKEPVHHDVTSSFAKDPDMAVYVAGQLKLLGTSHLRPLAFCKTELDGRFTSIRTKETGLGNFICDAVSHHMDSKICLINAGSFRSDSVESPGIITQQTIDTILPFKDEVVVVSYSGEQMLALLENSVSQYPLLAGRFCQVSGLSFAFDPRKKVGSRIERETVLYKNHSNVMTPFNVKNSYICAVKTYIFEGKDGYVRGEDGMILARSKLPIADIVSQFLKQSVFNGREADSETPMIAPQIEARIKCLHPDNVLK